MQPLGHALHALTVGVGVGTFFGSNCRGEACVVENREGVKWQARNGSTKARLQPTTILQDRIHLNNFCEGLGYMIMHQVGQKPRTIRLCTAWL